MPFFARRILTAIFLILGICILNFFLFHLSPGDPTNLYFGSKVKQENLQLLRQQRGLDQPWYQQLGLWLTHVFRGDLGYSWAKHRPVTDLLREAIPATLLLTGLALLVNIIVGCCVGILSGLYRAHWLGTFLNFSTLVIYSLPTFLIALLLILFFSLKLQWLPASQMQSLFLTKTDFWTTFLDRAQHLILPVVVLGLSGAAATSRFVQEHIREGRNQDYIRTALAKGLSKRRVYLYHAFKNALLPVITLLGLYWPFLLGGAFIVEVIFAWPGMGRIAYEAVFAKDYPVIMAVNLIAAVMVILGNLISDGLYRLIDPRIRFS